VEPAILVVDANIIISALLRDSTTRRLLLAERGPRLAVPEYLAAELAAHAGELAERLHTNELEITKTFNELVAAAKIEISRKEDYSEFLSVAVGFSPDPKDAPYFALALKLGCPLWSQDSALKKQAKIRVYTTKELLELG
jgi:predicted nucleic acid-binding protein